MTPQDQHDHEDESYGMALGFRIFEAEEKMYLAEAEIAPYVDEPQSLGATLVFHLLEGIDPSEAAEDEWPAWPTDIDEDLTRDEKAPAAQQFSEIARQLSRLSEDDLRRYLTRAMEEFGQEEG